MSRFVPFFPTYTPPVQEQKVFTQKEVEAIERFHLAKLEKEREAKEHALKRIQTLSNTISEYQTENQKLNFFIDVLSHTLLFVTKYKGTENKQQNG
ncbi:hypothetical protein [Mesobacillus jeotgali]|uniref:hypothetical protein n=1 Tax=Mesobacillus jeotgali TaxID=129985 RepID=UPI001CFE0546|nr:hypothetical protein [Mesobacillus jeotgali]